MILRRSAEPRECFRAVTQKRGPTREKEKVNHIIDAEKRKTRREIKREELTN